MDYFWFSLVHVWVFSPFSVFSFSEATTLSSHLFHQQQLLVLFTANLMIFGFNTISFVGSNHSKASMQLVHLILRVPFIPLAPSLSLYAPAFRSASYPPFSTIRSTLSAISLAFEFSASLLFPFWRCNSRWEKKERKLKRGFLAPRRTSRYR